MSRLFVRLGKHSQLYESKRLWDIDILDEEKQLEQCHLQPKYLCILIADI